MDPKKTRGRGRSIPPDKANESWTLEKVAKYAGVSPASVSRVLNRPEHVTPGIKAKVLSAFKELNYIPHGGARALASRRSNMIGAVVPTLSFAIFGSMVQALQVRLYDSQLQLTLASSEYDLEREFVQAEIFIARRVDGLVLIGGDHHPELYELLARTKTPFVNTFSYSTNPDRPSIGIDNARSTYELTSHLVELGHSQFGFLTSPIKGNDRVSGRLRGVRTCLADNGISFDDDRIIEVPYELSEGRNGFRALIQSFPDMTALVCSTDVLAFGAMLEAQEMGIGVPDRLSVTGFDDLDFASQIRPKLSTVHIPSRQIGVRAAEFLLARIEGRTVPMNTHLDADVLIRGSIGTAPKKGAARFTFGT